MGFRSVRRALAAAVPGLWLALCFGPVSLGAEEEGFEEAAQAPTDGPVLSFGLETKVHYRDSDSFVFPVTIPAAPPPSTDRAPADLATVDPGQHLELSVVTLLVNARWSESLEAHAKIDFVDLHDRNPTSEDRRVDVDEAWIRFGRAWEPAFLPERGGVYLKVGKMPKMERQNDRHLESYGLLSTAFNRFEDLGVELGVDVGRHLYLRGSVTQGNPVFFRDPNALAGDNGVPAQLGQPAGDNEALGTGIVILYDAEVEDLDTDGDLEVGLGAGVRFADATGDRGFELFAFSYQRDLAESVTLEGTFYGGDLDLLRGPFDAAPLPFSGTEKDEVGANLWLYYDGFSFFGQYVDQDIAGLVRTGYEGEFAWRFELPVRWAVAGRQLFGAIQPAVRYSKLDPEFGGNPLFPGPSVTWEWEKIDYGVRVDVLPSVDLTLEYAANDFVLASGATRSNDELLTTLRWRLGGE